MVLPELWSIEEIALFSSQVHSQFQQPFTLDDKKYQMTVSIGVSIYPDDAQTIEMVMRHADVAMFKAKSEGRNRTSFFSDELEQQIIYRHQLELLLRDTLDNRQLQVYYQPKLCLKTGKLLGAEALYPDAKPAGTMGLSVRIYSVGRRNRFNCRAGPTSLTSGLSGLFKLATTGLSGASVCQYCSGSVCRSTAGAANQRSAGRTASSQHNFWSWK